MTLLGRCPDDERAKREAMDDGEFWAYVLQGIEPGDDGREPEYDDPYSLDGCVEIGSECPECGAVDACGYDQEGRPMIHALSGDDTDDD